MERCTHARTHARAGKSVYGQKDRHIDVHRDKMQARARTHTHTQTQTHTHTDVWMDERTGLRDADRLEQFLRDRKMVGWMDG